MWSKVTEADTCPYHGLTRANVILDQYGIVVARYCIPGVVDLPS